MVQWSREATTLFAYTRLGEHIAPAIVVCCLYFIASVLTVLNFLATKYSWYDVLLISTLCTPFLSQCIHTCQPFGLVLRTKLLTCPRAQPFISLQSGR